MPGRVEADQESPCSATAMRKVMRRMTQLYDALAPAGLRTTQYSILKELHRPADAPPIAALQFVEVAARAQRPTARLAQDALKGLAPVLRRRKACGTGALGKPCRAM